MGTQQQLQQGGGATREPYEAGSRDDDWLIGSVDQGTTSSRFMIFNRAGDYVAGHQIDFENLYPRPGWHEQDPLLLLSTVQECIVQAVGKLGAAGYSASAIRAVGIANQRETAVVWDSRTGEPLCNAIAWPDTRTARLVRELKERDGAALLQERCGLPLSTYPSSVKLLWLLENVPEVQAASEAGTLAFGTVDSWLIYRLGGRARHVTDPTNASRTMFMNLRTLEYDDDLLAFFGIARSRVQLPRIVPCSDATEFGTLAEGPLRGVPIAGCLGDQSAALLGQGGVSPGRAKNTYGTGSFLLCNVGPEPVFSKSGLLATVAYQLGREARPAYALEGSVAAAGSAVRFLVDNLGMAEDAGAVSDLAGAVADSGGVVFVTAFSGLFSPYWIPDARGTLLGLTQHTSRGHVCRATLEAICFQTQAILEAMGRDSGHRLERLAVDGGMSGSDVCMQIQADVSGIPVDRPAMRETTALGAAMAAGLAVEGGWSDVAELAEIGCRGRTVFEPRMGEPERSGLLDMWGKAVERARGWGHGEG